MPEFPSAWSGESAGGSGESAGRFRALVVRGPDDVVAFLSACEVRTDEPAQVLLGLAVTEGDPSAHTICGAAVRAGADAERRLDAGQLADLADELLVGALVLATTAPGEVGPPSRHELTRFVALRRACADRGVALLDWIVLADGCWWSMRGWLLGEAA